MFWKDILINSDEEVMTEIQNFLYVREINRFTKGGKSIDISSRTKI